MLSSIDSENSYDDDESDEYSLSAQTRTSGMAWMYMNREGSLVYSVQLDELNMQDSPMLTLVAGHRNNGKRSMLELEDLTPSLTLGWANGEFEHCQIENKDHSALLQVFARNNMFYP